ncbi:MAG: DUF2062 domain-containing protein [bacterium]|nr:DUF2062 domain-containing protein [bacterium]
MGLPAGWRRDVRGAWRAAVGPTRDPRAVARGVAAGLLVAPTPVLGLHTWMALGLAAALRANRPAALLASNLSNPLTFLPLVLLDVRLGTWLLGRPLPDLAAGSSVLARLGEALLAAWLGAVVLGAALAAAVYPAALALARRRLAAAGADQSPSSPSGERSL